jgi:uncharacterized LabA/DUF88 family protein
MSGSNNYVFFDGSALIAEIRALQDDQPQFKTKRLLPLNCVEKFRGVAPLNQLLGGTYRRAVFYFADGDPQVERYVAIPDRTQSGMIRDVEFKYCGKKLARSKEYDEWLASVPPKFLDRCQKSEKGVDISICCDALGLAALGKLDRLALLTNDSDFIPLCEKLKSFGCNVSLIQLSAVRAVNTDLVNACDSYQFLSAAHLAEVFG